MKIEAKHQDGVMVLQPQDRLTILTLYPENAVKVSIHQALEMQERKILLDCSKVSRIDSWALGELLGLYCTVHHHGGTLKLFDVTKRVENILVITQVTAFFEIFKKGEFKKAIASFLID